MLVLTAPSSNDPRDDGFNHALPGELLCRPTVCDSGQDGACGCERSWVGVGSSKSTTLAEVRDLDMTPPEYIATIGMHLMQTRQLDLGDAYDEAQTLASIAADFEPGDLLTIGIAGEQQLIEVLEADRG